MFIRFIYTQYISPSIRMYVLPLSPLISLSLSSSLLSFISLFPLPLVLFIYLCLFLPLFPSHSTSMSFTNFIIIAIYLCTIFISVCPPLTPSLSISSYPLWGYLYLISSLSELFAPLRKAVVYTPLGTDVQRQGRSRRTKNHLFLWNWKCKYVLTIPCYLRHLTAIKSYTLLWTNRKK